MTMQGRIAILADDLYEDTELWYPYYRLREAGWETVILAREPGTYRSKAGYPAWADQAVADVGADGFDGLVIPGGYSPDKLRRHDDVIDFVFAMNDGGKPIGAICHAGWVLVSAGIVRGRRLTSSPAIRDDMVNAGADWIDEEVVVDGNLITSRGPADLPAFGAALVHALK